MVIYMTTWIFIEMCYRLLSKLLWSKQKSWLLLSSVKKAIPPQSENSITSHLVDQVKIVFDSSSPGSKDNLLASSVTSDPKTYPYSALCYPSSLLSPLSGHHHFYPRATLNWSSYLYPCPVQNTCNNQESFLLFNEKQNTLWLCLVTKCSPLIIE